MTIEEFMFLVNAFLIGAVILLVFFTIMVLIAFMFYAANESGNPRTNKLGRIMAYTFVILFLILAAIGVGDKWLNR